MRTNPTTSVQSPVVTSSQESQQPHRLLSLELRVQGFLRRTPVAVVAVAVGLITLLIHGYRLSSAPDIFSDEGVYILVGSNVARGFGLVLNPAGGTFLWHPPLYFLIEAAYIKLAGLTSKDPLTTLLATRYLNVFFSAATAVLLLLFGRKLHSYKAGLIMVVLFLMDPYVQRINRRSMLETLALLLVLLGLYIFLNYRPHLTRTQRLGSGIAFGLAMLTKEPMFLEMLALVAYVACFRRDQLRDVAWVIASACAIYLLYPLWAFAVGQGNLYVSFKLFGVDRILSSITGQRPISPAPGVELVDTTVVSPLDTLLTRLVQYGMSYLLIALAALFTAILILRFRHVIGAGYLITWSVFSLVFGLTLGNVSDQYYYFLIVPSIAVTGYVLASLLEIASRSNPRWKTPLFARGWPVFSSTPLYRLMLRMIFAIFLVIFLYNSFVWVQTYATGSDNAYINIVTYVRMHIPRGTTIETSDDVAAYFLSPTYNIRLDRSVNVIQDMHARYFIMSSKDAREEFDAMTPQIYNWVIHNSRPLFEENDQSFLKLGIYQLTAPSTPAPPPPSLTVTLHKSYLGTLYDVSVGLKLNISLTNIRQQQKKISGYFSSRPENSQYYNVPTNGYFTGTLNASNRFQFIVAGKKGEISFSFQGEIERDGIIAGAYCGAETARAACTSYGLWSVVPGP